MPKWVSVQLLHGEMKLDLGKVFEAYLHTFIKKTETVNRGYMKSHRGVHKLPKEMTIGSFQGWPHAGQLDKSVSVALPTDWSLRDCSVIPGVDISV